MRTNQSSVVSRIVPPIVTPVTSSVVAPTTSSMEQKIEEWILKKEAAGYNEEQLRQFLLSKGYDIMDVDEALKRTGKK
jgi:hypothetical protein